MNQSQNHTALLKRNADIMERHFGCGKTPIQISNTTGIPVVVIENILKLYNQPAHFEMVYPSKVNYGYMDWVIYDNWNKLPIDQIAELLARSSIMIKRRAKYLRLGKKKRMVTVKPKCTYRNRILLFNPQTGIYYFSNNEAADVIGMKRSTFKGQMRGYRSNRTGFIKA